MAGSRLTILVMMGVLGWPGTPAAAVQGGARATADSSLIVIADSGRVPRHPITLDDILSVREVVEPQLSPDGRWVAFLVRQAFRDCNCYRVGLFLVATHGGPAPTKLVEEASLTNLRWTPDGQFLTYLSTSSGSSQVWRVRREGSPPDPLFTHRGGAVDQYEWSPDGSQLAFSTLPAPDSARLRQLREGGVLYDDEQMWYTDILTHSWTQDPSQLWIYQVKTDSERRVWCAPRAGARLPVGIWDIAWSPGGDQIAVSYAAGNSSATGFPNYDIGTVHLTTGRFTALVTTDSTYEGALAWSPDGARLAFASEFEILLSSLGSQAALGIVDLASGQIEYVARGKRGPPLIAAIWWTVDGKALAFEVRNAGGLRRERAGLYQVELKSDQVRRISPTADHISSCGSLVGAMVACVRQSPTEPPNPATVDLSSGATRIAADVNPEIKQAIREPVTEIRWTNRFGAETNGFLVSPRTSGAHPLLVILYGFQGQFVAAAEYITSYPAQVFAREGFAVLLWNYPRADAPPTSNLDGAISSLEAVVKRLAREGSADSTRVGVMGLSLGGFWASLALAQTPLFRAGSMLNEVSLNPGAYWLFGNRAYRVLYELSLGGPPYGSTLANWLAYSPSLNAARVHAPVLIEASGEEAVRSLETYTALRRQGVPVEFVLYPEDGHVLSQPVHRIGSMQRNLDWFNFWLLGVEDTVPAKRDQYARWRQLRQLQKQTAADTGGVRHESN